MLGFTSCNKEEENTPVSIVGTWTYSDFSYEFEATDAGLSAIVNEILASAKEEIESYVMVFAEDGTYTITYSVSGIEESDYGTYTYEDGILTLDGEEVACELTATQLKLSASMESMLGDIGSYFDLSTVTKFEIYLIFDRMQ